MATIKVEPKAADIIREIFEKQKDQVNEYVQDQISRSFSPDFLLDRMPGIPRQPEAYYAAREKGSIDLMGPDGDVIAFDIGKAIPE